MVVDFLAEMSDSSCGFLWIHAISGKIWARKNRISIGKEQWFWFLKVILTAKYAKDIK
jgi:hypothetical protein